MMYVDMLDFNGLVNFAMSGDTLFFDKKYAPTVCAIHHASFKIRDWASEFYNYPLNYTKQVPLLESKLQQQSQFEQIYIADIRGGYFNASGQTQNISDRKYFWQVLKGRATVSEPIINRSTDNLVIAVIAPIYCANRISGLFGITIQIE
ncbi:MAG: PDC sensor domain-containing protein [Tannerella sp.]|jgi:hypothetical protein|nr:PDC sensor domain-containing protein [Tannerella sp.]